VALLGRKSLANCWKKIEPSCSSFIFVSWINIMSASKVFASVNNSCNLVSCFPFMFWLMILMVAPDFSRTSVALLFDPDGLGFGCGGKSQKGS